MQACVGVCVAHLDLYYRHVIEETSLETHLGEGRPCGVIEGTEVGEAQHVFRTDRRHRRGLIQVMVAHAV